MTHRTAVSITLLVTFLVAATLHAQEAVRREAPPEIRELIAAVVQAVNGSADNFESFAQARFAPELLEQQSRAEREALHRRMSDTFGQIAVGGVRREGPDGPLLLQVKGSKSNGVISVDIDGGAAPKIVAFSSETPAAQSAGPARAPVDATLTSDEIDRRLHDHVGKLAAGDAFSGVALVARNGVPVFFRAYGMADREKNIPNNIRTRFNLGSVNKAFTQVAIRQLVQEGKLALTDTLGKFFPDYPQAVTRGATIEQLLTHRAGVSDFFGPDFNRAPKSGFTSNADYFRFVSKLPPTFAPGERNQYCNGCYIALGAIVEKVSGMPYEKYVAEKIFQRAEMTSTGYPRSDRPAADIAIGYTRRGEAAGPALRPNTDLHGVTGSAAGGGYSTALDLLTYVKALRAGKFPGSNPDIGIAGGAPGINAIVEARGEWTVIVLANLDPPAASELGRSIADALSAGSPV